MELAFLSELGAWAVELAGTETGDTMFHCVMDCSSSVETSGTDGSRFCCCSVRGPRRWQCQLPSCTLLLGSSNLPLTRLVTHCVGFRLIVVPTFVRLVYNLLFVCFAWMINVIASIISHRMRGYPSQDDAIQQLLSSGYDCGTSTSQQCLQTAIYQGYFLEIGPTCINALFFSVATSLVLWIKMKYKQYVFSCVFAIIGLVINMSYGPLYPYFDGTLGVRISWL